MYMYIYIHTYIHTEKYKRDFYAKYKENVTTKGIFMYRI